MRDALGPIRAIPQALLVDPEQLSYDVAFALALVPSLALGIFFFRRPAALLLALCFLAGIVCLLALQLARSTIGLPAWVAFRASHPLTASLMVACFLPSTVPAWLGVAMVVLLVLLDSFLWPQLHPIAIQPALIVFGLAYLVERQLAIGFVNPFDLRPLDDPLSIWYRLHITIDPVKLYVGNVPGPLAATSMGALLLGLAYLWYTRKITLGVLIGFLGGIALTALALRTDVVFQLSSAPALFLAGYVVADRRRMVLDERAAIAMGALAGIATMVLRARGQGEEAAWEGLLAAGAAATIVVRGLGFLRDRRAAAPAVAGLRTLRVDSGSDQGAQRDVQAPALAGLRAQPVGLSAGTSAPLRSRPVQSQRFNPDDSSDPDDIVRQMRSFVAHRGIASDPEPWALWLLALVVLNPAGLWMTWTSMPLPRPVRIVVSVLSLAWYAGLAVLVLKLLHRL